MRCNPIYWLLGVVPIAALSWVAVQVQHEDIESDLARRTSEALKRVGLTWATPHVSGRDIVLTGKAPEERGPMLAEGYAQLAAAQRGSGMAGADAFFFIDPGDGLQFGVLADQGFGLAHKTCAIHFLVGQIARDAHQLFLALQQPQAHALLGVFHIALEGFVFAFDLFCPQIPESRYDGRHEQQHGSQRCQCSKTVLPGRREVAPPRTPPVRGGGQGGCRRGLVRDWGGVHRCQV